MHRTQGKEATMLRFTVIAASLVLVSVPAAAAPPDITSISPISAAEKQTIVIQGSGFGITAPYRGDSDYIAMDICRPKGCAFNFQYGYAPDNNGTGIVVVLWTDKQIILGGFTNYRNGGNIPLRNRDRVTVILFKPPTGRTGHLSKCEIEVGGGASVCTKR
jgi:hypothetical protein